MDDIHQRLRLAVARSMSHSEVGEGAATTLRDIGADALDCVVIAMEIEDEFSIEISDEDVETSTTICELVAMVNRKLAVA